MKQLVVGLLVAGGVCASWTAARGGPPAKERFAREGWSLDVRRDPFSLQTHCALTASNKHMLYQPAALGFVVHKPHDTLGAWYRVDDGPPVRWRDRFPELIEAGAEIDGPNLDNPTEGKVWVPIAEVMSAKSVRIRIGQRGGGQVFALKGFAYMLAAARRVGCSSDASFAS